MNPAGGQDGSVLGWANGVRVERFRFGNNNGDALRFYVGTGTVAFAQTPMLWTSANWGSWHHVALTCDRNLGVAKIYLNGVLSTTTNLSGNLLSTAGDFYLGRVPGSANYFWGRLDEISLYARPLNSEEVYNVFTSGSVGKCPNDENTPPLVYAGPDISVPGLANAGLNGVAIDDGLPRGASLRLEWKKYVGPGTVAFANSNSAATTATFSTNGFYVLRLSADDGEIQRSDLVEVRVGISCSVQNPPGLTSFWTGNGHSLDLITGQAAILGNGMGYSAGKVGAAFSFDGVNDYAWMPACSNYDVGPSASGFTLEFWINPTGGQNGSVLGWANGVRVERIRVGNNNGDALRFYVGAGTVPIAQTPMLWTSANWGSWHHLAVSYDRVLGQVKIYFNGALSTTTNIGLNLLSTAGDFYLGQVPGSAGFLWSQLDEVSLYNRPLAQAEIQSIVAAGASGKCVTPRNQPPTVFAGADKTIVLPATLALNGVVFDDGLPSNTLAIVWSNLVGPSSVSFTSTNSAATVVTFTAPGVYTFQLAANDGEFATNDTVNITVLPDPRTPPTIAFTSPTAGSLIEVSPGGITNLTLTATASDADGHVTAVQFYLNGNNVGTVPMRRSPW